MNFAVFTYKNEHFSDIQECFRMDGIVCQKFDDVASLLRASRTQNFDLILIDAQLFERSGSELMLWRACKSDKLMQIIVFGPFSNRDSMIKVFDSDIADVVAGSLEKNEMYARVYRLLRSQRTLLYAQKETFTVCGYTFDQSQSKITYQGKSISLTSREFSIAWLFFSNPNTFFTKQRLASIIWGSPLDCVERTIEQHIYKIRKKLLLTRSSNVRLLTVYSLGYKLEIHGANTDTDFEWARHKKTLTINNLK